MQPVGVACEDLHPDSTSAARAASCRGARADFPVAAFPALDATATVAPAAGSPRAGASPTSTMAAPVRTLGQLSAGTASHPFAGVDWAALTRSPACGGVQNVLQQVVDGDVTGDGIPEAVVLTRCDAGAGSPPSQLYVFTTGALGGAPRLLATLLDGTQWQVGSVKVRDGRIVVDGAKSSPAAPSCCPDIHRHLSWHWNGATFAP
jgi:hypothetical protein